MYDIQEKNKFISRMVRLEWSRDDLLELLLSRISANEELASLAELMSMVQAGRPAAAALRIIFPETVEDQPFFDWFFSSLANGNRRIAPRQIIMF
jgi:hypothetical protein